MKTTAKSNLRKRRLASRISLQAVASRFGHGVSRERIRQIEASARVRPETRAEYERALASALRQRDAIEQLAVMLDDGATV